MEQTLRATNRLTEDTLTQINSLKDAVKVHLRAVRDQRQQHPHGRPYSISEDALDNLYDKADKIRESGELINFNIFSCDVDQIEKLLKKLRTPIQYRRTDILSDLLAVLEHLEQSLQ